VTSSTVRKGKSAEPPATTLAVPDVPRPPQQNYLPPLPGEEVFNGVLNRLSTGDREDFVKMLTNWTICAPGTDPSTLPALQALARKYPDRYMQGMTMVARIAGLMGDPDAQRGGTTIIAFVQQLQQLSDAELYRQARENAMSIIRSVGNVGGTGSPTHSGVARTPVQLRQPPPLPPPPSGVVIDGEKV
jgi:hypothetical protein